MGFLKRLVKNTYRDGFVQQERSSFDNLSEEELERHMATAQYGEFLLTNAVRPSYNLEIVPKAGYRREVYRDPETGTEIPVLLISESRERLFDLFMDLLEPLGNEVDVVLESSHDSDSGKHRDYYREQIDLPVLKSTLYDFEEQVLEDGCLGIAVLNPGIPWEVQFDEHKLLFVYGQDLWPFEERLDDYNLPCSEEMRFITEAEHVHSSSEDFAERFSEFRYRLGIEV